MCDVGDFGVLPHRKDHILIRCTCIEDKLQGVPARIETLWNKDMGAHWGHNGSNHQYCVLSTGGDSLGPSTERITSVSEVVSILDMNGDSEHRFASSSLQPHVSTVPECRCGSCSGSSCADCSFFINFEYENKENRWHSKTRRPTQDSSQGYVYVLLFS
ncbi:uncharacterized protein LOC104899851 isoform X1 [Beta vulgaris subsp. vulgaris]|uniref:uncharacterized protein LOC104899851 isoform X1 n=1 Tax=Beta vulgaris subsp. vulgaris TaxID=3555 RepID=UPI0020373618|nr:uncharacterized protein LOC104899851 isoform X1 [Beta vulgaris subsp. vulgaris]